MQENSPATDTKLPQHYFRIARRLIVTATAMTLMFWFTESSVYVGGIKFYLMVFLAGIVGGLIGCLPDLVFPLDMIEAQHKRANNSSAKRP